jgi:hypothetical protein
MFSKLLRSLAVSFVIVCAFSSLSLATAQSGRREPKSKPVVATPTPEPEPTPTASSELPQPLFRLIVGIEKYDSFSSVSLSTFSSVMRNCTARLDEPNWIKVEAAQASMSRGDALKRAKAEKDSYVVWLHVREDQMSSNQPGTANNAYIEYAVFSPITAKVLISGGTYPRKGNANVVMGPTSGIDGDYNLNKAARDTADKIIAKFRGRIPQSSEPQAYNGR